MKKKPFTILILLLLISFNVISQEKNDSIRLIKFKKFLPYLLTPDSKSQYPIIDNKTNGIFIKPWNEIKTQKNKGIEILEKLVKNAKIKIEKDSKGNFNLKYESKLNINEDSGFKNLNISIEDIVLKDINNQSILKLDDKKKSIFEPEDLIKFNKIYFLKKIPIIRNAKSLKGKISFSINEFRKFSSKKLFKKQENINFNIGKHKVQLLFIENNKAHLLLPKDLDMNELEFVGINKVGEKYSAQMKLQLPKKVFDFKQQNDLKNKKKIKDFISSLTFEDIFKSEKILTFKTNGIIEELFIFKRSSNLKLGQITSEINYEL